MKVYLQEGEIKEEGNNNKKPKQIIKAK